MHRITCSAKCTTKSSANVLTLRNFFILAQSQETLRSWSKYKVKPGVQLESREGFIGHLETGQSTGPKQWEFIKSWEENTFNELIQQVNIKTIK